MSLGLYNRVSWLINTFYFNKFNNILMIEWTGWKNENHLLNQYTGKHTWFEDRKLCSKSWLMIPVGHEFGGPEVPRGICVWNPGQGKHRTYLFLIFDRLVGQVQSVYTSPWVILVRVICGDSVFYNVLRYPVPYVHGPSLAAAECLIKNVFSLCKAN